MPLVDGIESNLGRKLQEASAHSGYLSEPNLAALEARGIRAYIAAGRARYPAAAHNLRAALGEAAVGR